MKRFTIKSSQSRTMNPLNLTTSTRKGNFLSRDINAFYHEDYHGGNEQLRNTPGTVENIITTLKNSYQDKHDSVLSAARNNLFQILYVDFPKILAITGASNLTVCVIPRSKAENTYSKNQLIFKETVKTTVSTLIMTGQRRFIDGTSYIRRHTNTRTTHLDKSGYGGDGALPYPGITKETCTISTEIRGKDILLIDDLYTLTINIVEDAIQAMLDCGANSVTFYSLGKTLSRY